MSSFAELRAHLDRFAAEWWRDVEHADAALDGLNGLLARLYPLGLWQPTVILGPFVLTRSYGNLSRTDTGQAIQAVLSFPGGFGAVYWDTEDAVVAREAETLKAEVAPRMVPYEQCEPAVRALLAPHVAVLLQKALAKIDL
jgi:hypothetical protein